MKKLLSTAAIAAITASLLVSACGVSKRDFESVSAENESIKAENESLASNLKEVNDKTESLQEVIDRSFISADKTKLGKMHIKYPLDGYSIQKSTDTALSMNKGMNVLYFGFMDIKTILNRETTESDIDLSLIQNTLLTSVTDKFISGAKDPEIKSQEFTNILGNPAQKTVYSFTQGDRFETIFYTIYYDYAVYIISYANKDSIVDTSVIDFVIDNIKFEK